MDKGVVMKLKRSNDRKVANLVTKNGKQAAMANTFGLPAGKGGVVGAVAGEVVSLAKGSTKKDFDEINRLENKLAQITGKGKSKATAGRQGAQQQLSQLASLASLGVVGKTRRQRMVLLQPMVLEFSKPILVVVHG